MASLVVMSKMGYKVNRSMIGRLVKSGNSGGGGDFDMSKFKEIVMGVGIAILILVVIVFVIGTLGVNLLAQINPSNYPVGSAQYNQSVSLVKTLGSTTSILSSFVGLLTIAVIMIVISFVLYIIIKHIGNIGS